MKIIHQKLTSVSSFSDGQNSRGWNVTRISCRNGNLATFATISFRNNLFSDLFQRLISAIFNLMGKNCLIFSYKCDSGLLLHSLCHFSLHFVIFLELWWWFIRFWKNFVELSAFLNRFLFFSSSLKLLFLATFSFLNLCEI